MTFQLDTQKVSTTAIIVKGLSYKVLLGCFQSQILGIIPLSFPNRMPPCNYCKNRHEDTVPSETQCPSCLTYHDSIVNNVKIVQISIKKEATVDDLLELIQKKFKGTISDELNAKPMAVPPMKIYLKDSNVKPTRTSTARAVPKRFELSLIHI